MSIEYRLSATDILDIFYDIPKKALINKKLESIEKEYNIILPDIFKKFMCSANKMLETADVWDYGENYSWYFLYDWINISVNEIVRENGKIDKDSEYFYFANFPVSEWNNFVDDYMIIGSDYAAGIVYFGIKKSDLNMKNPPVYMYHEMNSITEWNLMYNYLSEYFSVVVCDAILGELYDTAQRVLKYYNWNYETYNTGLKDILYKYGIVPDNLQKLSSIYRESDNDWISCCYDTEEKILFLFQNKKDDIKICIIWK